MRRAARVDGNHRVIVTALERVGCFVQSLAAVGAGVPDLLVGCRMETHLLEVKDPAQVPSKRKLTPAQVDWHRLWRGKPVRIVETVEQAFDAVGVTVTHRRDAGFKVPHVSPPAFDSANYRGHP